MPTPPNYWSFLAALGTGVQRPWRYYVMFSPPSGLGSGKGDARFIPALAQKVGLPGREMETAEFRHLGQIRHMPGYALYAPVQFTFICDEGMKMKKLMDAWQNLICEPGNNYMGYYDDYARGSCTVISLDNRGLPTYGVRLNEFYPRRVDEIVFEAAGSTNYATLEVEFVMKSWENVDALSNSPQANSKDFAAALGFDVESYINTLPNNDPSLNKAELLTEARNSVQNLKSGYKSLVFGEGVLQSLETITAIAANSLSKTAKPTKTGS
jgi:hypothetical protein